MLKKRHYIPVMMVLMLFSAYAFAGIDGDISKSFKVGTGGQLTLETDLGAVEVETHNKNSVEVEVKFRPRRRGRDRMLEIMEDRHGARSTLATSQLPIEKWHDTIGDPTMADAILDRLVHNAYKINLKGGSMRKRKANLTQTTQPE